MATIKEVLRAYHRQPPTVARRAQDLRVMTTLELNVINAAKATAHTSDFAAAERALKRLLKAVQVLEAVEEHDRLERDRTRKARSRAGTRNAIK